MTDDLMDEDALRRGLAPLVHGSPPPLSTIEARTATLRRRKHWKGAWIAAGVSVTALTLAAAGQMHFFGYDSELAQVPMCGPVGDMGTAFESLSVTPAELPDEFRLSWSGSDFPEPKWALARREEHPCAYAPTLRLIDVEQGLIVRSVDVSASPASDSQASQPDRFDLKATGNGGVNGWRSFWTPGDGYGYEVTTFGTGRSATESLLKALQTNGGQPTVANWSLADDFEIIQRTDVPSDGTRYSWMLSSNVFDSDSTAFANLDVFEDPDPLLMQAYAGDRLIDLNGEDALQSPDGTVTWSPREGLIASLHGSASSAELRALARSVVPMSSTEFDLISNG